MEDNQSLFRKKSLKKLSDPEQLNDYVKEVSAPVWLVLIGVIVIIVGVLVWSSVAVLEQKKTVVIQVTEDASYIIYSSDDINSIRNGDIVREKNGNTDYEVIVTDSTLSGKWQDVNLSDYFNILSGDWVCKAEISETNLAPGYYEGYVVIGTYHPISFLIQ